MNEIIVNTTDIWQNATNTLESEIPPLIQRINIGVRLFEGFLAVTTNSLTILAVLKYEFLRTNTNLLICSLAVADLLGGITPFFILAHFNLTSDVNQWLILCTIERSLSLLSGGLNIMSIMWVSVDRFMYISFPLKYHTLVQTWHIWASVGISWLLSCMTIALATGFGVQASEDLVCRSQTLYVNQTVHGGLTYGFIGTFMIITFLIYGKIAIVAHKQARSIGFQMSGAADAGITLSKAETKITKMMALVLGLYISCYLPQIILLIIIRGLNDPPAWLSIIEIASSWIWWINSWMNPIIYAWKSRQFNRGFRLLLGLKPQDSSP